MGQWVTFMASGWNGATASTWLKSGSENMQYNQGVVGGNEIELVPVKMTVLRGLEPHISMKCTESPKRKLGCPQKTTQG